MTILCYHSINPNWRSPLAVHPTAFAAQCAWLRRHRQLITLEVAIEEAIRSRPRTSRGVAVTFDDALEDFYDYAFPILERHAIPASVFVVTRTLQRSPREASWIDPRPERPIRTLTAKQIVELHDKGVSFYSHTHTHRDLTSLDDATCEEDLRTSREVLERMLGTPVNILAYPRGDHDARVAHLTARAGFKYAVGTSKFVGVSGPYGIPRAGVYAGDGILATRIKTTPWYMALRHNRLTGRTRHEMAELARRVVLSRTLR